MERLGPEEHRARPARRGRRGRARSPEAEDERQKEAVARVREMKRRATGEDEGPVVAAPAPEEAPVRLFAREERAAAAALGGKTEEEFEREQRREERERKRLGMFAAPVALKPQGPAPWYASAPSAEVDAGAEARGRAATIEGRRGAPGARRPAAARAGPDARARAHPAARRARRRRPALPAPERERRRRSRSRDRSRRRRDRDRSRRRRGRDDEFAALRKRAPRSAGRRSGAQAGAAVARGAG